VVIQACGTIQDFKELVAASYQTPVFLLKHSTRCPISARGWQEFQRFAEGESDAKCFQLLVIENRPISLHVASETGIQHQSPQVILFKDGKAVWHTSHWSITQESMKEALAETASA
jgi:bacillithiol system protein YtxJ